MFTDPVFFFNTTMVNTSAPGQVIAEVYGMDILISLAIVQTMMLSIMVIYLIMGRNLHSRRWKK